MHSRLRNGSIIMMIGQKHKIKIVTKKVTAQEQHARILASITDRLNEINNINTQLDSGTWPPVRERPQSKIPPSGFWDETFEGKHGLKSRQERPKGKLRTIASRYMSRAFRVLRGLLREINIQIPERPKGPRGKHSHSNAVQRRRHDDVRFTNNVGPK